jgi:hypothetical protein
MTISVKIGNFGIDIMNIMKSKESGNQSGKESQNKIYRNQIIKIRRKNIIKSRKE